MVKWNNVKVLLLETDTSWDVLNWFTVGSSIESYKTRLTDSLGADFSRAKTSVHPFSLKITKDQMVFKPLERIVHSKNMNTIMSLTIDMKPNQKGGQTQSILSADPWKDLDGKPVEPAFRQFCYS